MGIVSIFTSFNQKKYFKLRRIAMGTEGKHNLLIRKIALIRVLKTNRRFCSNIYTGIRGGAHFESDPILPHDLCGIFIASTAKIGRNCTILQQVTIGGNPATYDGTSPISQAATIGDDVIIGAGAKIIGNVLIGNGVRIGANAVVTHDIPDRCVVAGIPAKIIKSSIGNEH